jgi:hypothetical protein
MDDTWALDPAAPEHPERWMPNSLNFRLLGRGVRGAADDEGIVRTVRTAPRTYKLADRATVREAYCNAMDAYQAAMLALLTELAPDREPGARKAPKRLSPEATLAALQALRLEKVRIFEAALTELQAAQWWSDPYAAVVDRETVLDHTWHDMYMQALDTQEKQRHAVVVEGGRRSRTRTRAGIARRSRSRARR